MLTATGHLEWTNVTAVTAAENRGIGLTQLLKSILMSFPFVIMSPVYTSVLERKNSYMMILSPPLRIGLKSSKFLTLTSSSISASDSQ